MEITPRQLEIIEATGKILTTSGVSRLTIKNLAKEMQFSESAIYRHFESKEEILLMMLQYLRYNITLIKSSLSKTDDVEKDFCMFFQKLSKFFNANPYFAVAVFSEGLLDENEKLNKEIMGLMSMFYGYLQSIIAEGQNQHIFLPSISAGDLTMVVIATFKHYMFSWKFDKFNSDLLVSIHRMCAQLLTLMKNNPTQS